MANKAQANARFTALLLIAMAPIIFALITWERDITFNPVRSFSLPVILVEYTVICLAALTGRLLPAIRSTPLKVVLPILALIAIQIYTAAFVAGHQGMATAQLVIGWGHILFAFAIYSLFKRQDQASLVSAIVVGLCVFTVIVYGLALSVATSPDFQWIRFGAAVTNVRHLGYYGALLVALALGLFVEGRKHWALTGVVLGLALLFWTGSRGGIFALLFMGGAVLCLSGWVKARQSALVVLLACLPALVLTSVWVPPDPSWGPMSMLGRTDRGTLNAVSSGRVAIWKQTVAQGLDRPLLGWGEGQFKYDIPLARSYFNHPHNVFVQYFYQWGFVGLVLMMLLLILAIRHVRRTIKSGPDPSLPALMGFSCLLGFSLVDGTLYYPYPVMMLLVCLCLLISSQPPDHA